MAKAKKKEAKVCYPCKTSDWLFPLTIIALIWIWPAVLWSKIAITVLAVFMFGSNACPCRKK